MSSVLCLALDTMDQSQGEPGTRSPAVMGQSQGEPGTRSPAVMGQSQVVGMHAGKASVCQRDEKPAFSMLLQNL
ncbi:unnamed protein product [Boreogadus saida]